MVTKSWNFDFFLETTSHEFVIWRSILYNCSLLYKENKYIALSKWKKNQDSSFYDFGFIQIANCTMYPSCKAKLMIIVEDSIWFDINVWFGGLRLLGCPCPNIFPRTILHSLRYIKSKRESKIWHRTFWQKSIFCFTHHFTVCSTWHLAAVLSPLHLCSQYQ